MSADTISTNEAYNSAVPHGIQGLYQSLSAASTILRIARGMGELDASVAAAASTLEGEEGEENNISMSGDDSLQRFFDRLDQMERELALHPKTVPQKPPCYHVAGDGGTSRKPSRVYSKIAVVEGLDGSGKSSLVQTLVEALNQLNPPCAATGTPMKCPQIRAVALATPTESMTNVRPVFDKRGGPVARAFYAVSNYMLQYEIEQLERQLEEEESVMHDCNQSTILIAVVDRWYTSTVAYSVAWRNTHGGVDSVNALDASIFAWPKDTRRPDIFFLLQVDDRIRRERVQHRNNRLEEEGGTGASTPNKFNPWDQRLDQDQSLGQRIMRSFERVAIGLSSHNGTTTTVVLDANQAREEVLADAVQAVRKHMLKRSSSYSQVLNLERGMDCDPLAYFQWVCSELKLCHPESGHRLKHAPWAMQIAWNQSERGDQTASNIPDFVASPILKTVGIHSVNASGIVCFMRDAIATNREATTSASIVWVGGDYPYEQQWRAEGFLQTISAQECQILDCHPPPSLIAYTAACFDAENRCDSNVTMLSTPQMQERVRNTAMDYRQNFVSTQDTKPLGATPVGTRFVPLRMEVLMGGPSSPGGTRRFEWTRKVETNGWGCPRPLSPFRGAGLISQLRIPSRLKPITVAITGTHCAGKATIGKRLVEIFGDGWSPMDLELGDLLRSQDVLAASAHRIGDGSGALNAVSWDDRVHEAELNRDEHSPKSGQSRVVETWHVGNLAWAMLRADNRNASSDEKDNLVRRVKEAIQQHMHDHVVLMVHLTVQPEDTLRRRRNEAANMLRLPMSEETKECTELHRYLDIRTKEFRNMFTEELDVPTCDIDNASDNNMKEALQEIVQFVNGQQWRRAML